jgi:hydroxymethylpyrimidine pyrophosphatase-like HAD family hydrolase
MTVELVVTDLDGTFWDTPERVHPRALAAMREVVGRGIPVLVATARRTRSARGSLAKLDLAPPAVLFNGGLLVDLATDERLHHHTFDRADAVATLAAFASCGVSPCVYVEREELDVYVAAATNTHPGHLRSMGEWAAVADLDEVVRTQPVFAFGVLGHAAEPLAAVAAMLAGTASTHLAPDRNWGDASLIVTPRDLSKWAGVTAFCRHAGIDPTATVALGDGPNDLEILARASIALVPSDGHEDALACAHRVIGPASDGGWAEVLEVLP